MNNTIPSFKASLLQNPETRQPAPTVDEIMADVPAQQDFVQPKNGSSGVVLKTVSGVLALTALGVLGRRGTFGKSVQKFLGGIPKLSTEQIQEQIASKLTDYISRTEATPFTMKILGNGKTTATRILANGEKEIISFSKDSGMPELRVLFGKAKGKKALNYTTYKGADVLDDGFDAANNFYKKYSRNGIRRKHLFGQKHNKTQITYGDQVRGDGTSQVLRETTYYRNGDLNNIVEQDHGSGVATIRDMLYGKDKKIKGLDIISSDGTIIRKVKGENPVLVTEPHRPNNRLQKFLKFFSWQKRNVID